jgi:hypothetical protein
MDVTVLNGRIDGYEIKSDRDRLDRLERQLVQYIPIYDRLTVVTTERHRDAVAGAVPEWCGILVAGIVGDHVALFTEREPTENPQWDVRSVLFLLWQTETRQLARKYGVSYSSATSKGITQARLAEAVSSEILRAEVIDVLKLRQWSDTHIRG